MRTLLHTTLLGVLLALGLPALAHGYGAYHAGVTTVGPGGVSHVGTTTAAGPNGAITHTGGTVATPGGAMQVGSTTVKGANGDTFTTAGARAYSPTTHAGYSAVGVQGAYTTGVAHVGYVGR